MDAKTAAATIDTRRLLQRLGQKIVKAFRTPSLLEAPPHVGMFAGSLLSHESWTPPKVPH
jgi:hypothetical protein